MEMEEAILPKEKACEPNEEAQQPELKQSLKSKKNITFEEDVDVSAGNGSQNSSIYKDVLSQPGNGLSHRQRLLWLQKRRGAGLWVQCDECDRWRYLPNIEDNQELPHKWYCHMNPVLCLPQMEAEREECSLIKTNKMEVFKFNMDIYVKYATYNEVLENSTMSQCAAPEAAIHLRDEEDLIHSQYSAGSAVWARLPGWPWWPAMVDDCPDTEQFYWLDGFSDIPTHYNVVFFDTCEPTRAWISPNALMPYYANKNKVYNKLTKNRKLKARIQGAMSQADVAIKLSLSDRLAKYSFLARFKGNINFPRKINKDKLKKYSRQFEKKFNVTLGNIQSSDSDSDVDINDLQNVAKNKKPNSKIINKRSKANVKPKDTRYTDIVDKSRSMDIQKHFAETAQSDYNQEIMTLSKAAQLGSNNMEYATLLNHETCNLDQNNTDGSFIRPTFQTEGSFRVGIATPNSDDFEF